MTNVARQLTNPIVIPRIKIYFQRFPGTAGTNAERGIGGVDYEIWSSDMRTKKKGTTGADGSVELVLASSRAFLKIFGQVYTVTRRGRLEPVRSIEGQQRRLQMLGYGP